MSEPHSRRVYQDMSNPTAPNETLSALGERYLQATERKAAAKLALLDALEAALTETCRRLREPVTPTDKGTT